MVYKIHYGKIIKMILVGINIIQTFIKYLIYYIIIYKPSIEMNINVIQTK